MVTRRNQEESDHVKRPRARTPEQRENQLANLAFDLAERQLREGTASAMLMVHLMKLKTVEQKLKEEKLRKENLLTEARVEALGSSKEAEARYAEAVRAIKSYQGFGEDEDV